MKTFKIVICDDEQRYIDITRDLLEEYFSSLGCSSEIVAFTEGESCLSYLECHEVDLIFLDIFLDKEQLGTSLALKMREHSKNSKLVFLSSSNEFATESFAAQASYYLIKPLTTEKLEKALISCKLTEVPHSVSINTGRETINLDTNKVIAIEVQDKYLYIHTKAGVLKVYCSLNRIQEYFQEPDFLQIHRSFIINLNHVKKLDGDTFVMTDDFRAPIKIRGAKAIKDHYMHWLFNHL